MTPPRPKPNLQFSLGPVQGFIRQARRTRDLWSGSYILSYLSARAMKGVIGTGGTIIVPKVWDDDAPKDHLLAWVMDDKSGDPPRIGTIPNRFQAWASNPKEAARAAEAQIKGAWKDIYTAIWNKFLGDITPKYGFNTQKIWNRQVGDFWEIYWTEGNLSTMESRKNWRTRNLWSSQLPKLEVGDHCTMMGEWQELSGFTRSHSRTERAKQDDFWERLRKVPEVGRLDFREDERLCSIALIKRMFPKVAKDAIGWEVKADRWPSTLYVAALPWLSEINLKKAELAGSYFNLVKDATEKGSVMRKGVWEQVGGSQDTDLLDFLELDGNLYFKSSVSNHRHTPLKGTPLKWSNEESYEVKEKRQGLIKHLDRLNEEVGRPPSPFYGMLLMDGDSMGKLLVDHGEEVSSALAEFSIHVDPIVKKHGGVTVYAGGDDVLAMLPVTTGIDCAAEISECFEVIFKKTFEKSASGGSKPNGTISAGLVLAHGRSPLRSVLEEAHHILDHVAKDGNGRQSIAVSVLKSSGKYCQWVATLPSLRQSEGTIFDSLVAALGGEEAQFSTSFFFGMRDILTILSSKPYWQPGSYLKLTDDFHERDIVDLLTAEYMKSEHGKANIEKARPNVEHLLSVSYRYYRNRQEECVKDERQLGADGAMLVKFLVEGGKED